MPNVTSSGSEAILKSKTFWTNALVGILLAYLQYKGYTPSLVENIGAFGAANVGMGIARGQIKLG